MARDPRRQERPDSTTNRPEDPRGLSRPEGGEDAPSTNARRDLIEGWLLARVAERIGISPQDLSVSEPLASYGLDSAVAVGLSGDLEEFLDRKLSPTLVWDYPTIERLARHLAEAA